MTFAAEGREAIIHFNVPPKIKARWVRQSQREGRKLSDWVIDRVETPLEKLVLITIPANLAFSDLKLGRAADGAVSFDWTPIERICAASGIDISLLREQGEDNVANLLTVWYQHHLANGGAPDPVYTDLIGEVKLEDQRGGGLSHQPGRA